MSVHHQILVRVSSILLCGHGAIHLVEMRFTLRSLARNQMLHGAVVRLARQLLATNELLYLIHICLARAPWRWIPPNSAQAHRDAAGRNRGGCHAKTSRSSSGPATTEEITGQLCVDGICFGMLVGGVMKNTFHVLDTLFQRGMPVQH